MRLSNYVGLLRCCARGIDLMFRSGCIFILSSRRVTNYIIFAYVRLRSSGPMWTVAVGRIVSRHFDLGLLTGLCVRGLYAILSDEVYQSCGKLLLRRDCRSVRVRWLLS